jgi:protein-S-isoprenylcysteine O-methyltransferase Ste14
MNEATLVILVHQVLFQTCFMVKNIVLSRKLGVSVRGNNPEARRAILFFVLFIVLSLALAASGNQWASLHWLPEQAALGLCVLVLACNLVFGIASLRDLRESWRVGVLENQATELVEDGIYRFTRNPYFVAYLLMFVAYTVLLQNLLLLALSFLGFGLIHGMILKEEEYLEERHGQAYRDYQRRVPRYLLL